MRQVYLLLLPLLLTAQEPSMLSQASLLSKKFSLEVAKAPPPAQIPQAKSCLDTASVWFTLNLEELQAPALQTLNNEMFWDCLKEIGVVGVDLKGLKKGGRFRTGIGLDPKWGEGWNDVAVILQKKGIVLIGEAMGNCTGLSNDFYLALKNVGDYANLYHLVEVEKQDWKWLPTVGPSQLAANVPWLNLQELHKKGYVPEQFAPYVKESSWNTTGPIQCEDGKVRRWIYLKENRSDPVIDWLNSSFTGYRIAAADTLDSIFNLGQKIVKFDGTIEEGAKETLALWTRKLGGYSVLEAKGGLDELKGVSTDLMTDTITRPALLHALIAEDAEALKLMYRLYLEEGIETKRLVHVLQPFDEFLCDWKELAAHPKKRFQYYEEVLTGEALRTRLLKEDAFRIQEAKNKTWPALCISAGGKRENVGELHALLALFYAMQPGAFSFSASDLLGTLKKQTVDLMGTNENTVYPSLPGQWKNPKSFAMQLKKIFSVRRESGIETAELVAVPETAQRGFMILVYRLQNGMTQMVAINFGKTAAQQILEMPNIRQTTAIDLMTALAEKKPLDSATIRLDVPALSGKVILFQTKYYD